MTVAAETLRFINHRFPPAAWISLETVGCDRRETQDVWRYQRETPWMEYQFVGFAWTNAEDAVLYDVKVGGGAILTADEGGLRLRRHGWMLFPRHWPMVRYANQPDIQIAAATSTTRELAPHVTALALIKDDGCFMSRFGAPAPQAYPAYAMTEESLRAFMEANGQVQMWDSWPDCATHDENAEAHFVHMQTQWQEWIERAVQALERAAEAAEQE